MTGNGRSSPSSRRPTGGSSLLARKGEQVEAHHATTHRFNVREEAETARDHQTAAHGHRGEECGTDRAPTPFDTTSFIVAAGRIGLSAANAMRIAEDLYVNGFISIAPPDRQHGLSKDTRPRNSRVSGQRSCQVTLSGSSPTDALCQRRGRNPPRITLPSTRRARRPARRSRVTSGKINANWSCGASSLPFRQTPTGPR